MNLSALVGNGPLKHQLSQRQEGRGLSHAYILSGPAGSGRHTLALTLAAAMMCTGAGEDRPCCHCVPCRKVLGGVHPDVSVLSGPGEGKSITVDQIRSLRADAYIRPNEGERKVYLLEGADEMNAAAQNAMLKLLEDGPAYAAFLLLAENGTGLLETVRSRCEGLTLNPVTPAQAEEWLLQRYPQMDQQAVRRAAADCQGILGRAVAELEGDDSTRRQRMELAGALAQAVEQGDELALFQTGMALEKLPKEELPRLMEQLVTELTGRMARGRGDKRRLLKGVETARLLSQGLALNLNPGQAAGWLCAQMFMDG